MDVSEVKGDVRVEADRVYVIPPSQDIVLGDGMLKLVPRSKTGGAHMPIDSFLQSLAEAQGSQSIGVILSGMGSDGTLGLEAIKAEGGITLAQEPRSAKNEDMPRSAIAAGCVDFVLAPEDIARELVRLGRHPYVAANASLAPVSSEGPASDGLARILLLLMQATGADFSGYKTTTLERRIARRMAVRRIPTLEDYALHLEVDKEETGRSTRIASSPSPPSSAKPRSSRPSASGSSPPSSPTGPPTPPSGSGFPGAPVVRRRTRSPSASWRRPARSRATRPSRSSAPTSATLL